MGCLIGVPIAACMMIPIIIAFIGVEQKRHAMVWALLFLGLIILNQALVSLPFQTGINVAYHLYWNWFGKLFEIAWAIPFIALGPITFANAGFRKPLPATTARAITVAIIVAILAFIVDWFLHTNTPRSTAMFLYQLTMPTIAEETVFRGVLFAVLEKAFKARDQTEQHWWQSRAVWLTTLVFALVHGWTVEHGAFQFNAAACIFPFIFGLIAGALRKYSGSLAFPMALHSVVNVAAATFP